MSARLGQVQTSPWLSANITKPSMALSKNSSSSWQHVGEEDVRGFAAELEGYGNQVLAGVLHDEAARGGFAGESNFGDARAGGQGLAGFEAKPVDDIEHARRQQVAHQLGPDEDAGGGLLGRLETTQLPAASAGASFHVAMSMGKVPRNDLADHAEGLVEVIGNRVAINFRDGAFLRADAAGEVTPVVDGEGEIGSSGFADGLAVVPGLGQRQQVEIFFHALGDLIEDDCALRGTGVAPTFAGGMGRVERAIDILRVGARNLAEGFARDRGDVFEILAGSGLDPLAANVVAIARAEADAIAELARM